MNLFTRKRSPFTSKGSNGSNTINTVNTNHVNPYSYAKRNEFNWNKRYRPSPLNRAKLISYKNTYELNPLFEPSKKAEKEPPLYEIGEKVGLREIPDHVNPYYRELLQDAKVGIISDVIKGDDGDIWYYIVKFGTHDIVFLQRDLKKISQDGGSKKRHRRSRRRTMRRKY